jgi:hypothetical protein
MGRPWLITREVVCWVLVLLDRDGASAMLLYSSSGRLDTGIVPKLYPPDWTISLGYVR